MRLLPFPTASVLLPSPHTFRTDYEADWARLDDFQVLTAEADKLLHRLIRASREIPYHNADGQEVILVSFLERHVLTVLADIARKKLSNYGNSFANVQGMQDGGSSDEQPGF